jgi:hypothetical protein
VLEPDHFESCGRVRKRRGEIWGEGDSERRKSAGGDGGAFVRGYRESPTGEPKTKS